MYAITSFTDAIAQPVGSYNHGNAYWRDLTADIYATLQPNKMYVVRNRNDEYESGLEYGNAMTYMLNTIIRHDVFIDNILANAGVQMQIACKRKPSHYATYYQVDMYGRAWTHTNSAEWKNMLERHVTWFSKISRIAPSRMLAVRALSGMFGTNDRALETMIEGFMRTIATIPDDDFAALFIRYMHHDELVKWFEEIKMHLCNILTEFMPLEIAHVIIAHI